MSVATYLAGTAAIAAVVVALAWGARRVRAAVVPGWSGPPAWLADIVIALAALVTVSQLLGAMHLFSRWPVLVGLVTVGVGMGLVASRFGVNTGRIGDPADAKTGRGEEVIAAVLAGALIAAQWTTHVAVALGSGMTHPDTLWYHQPFAARFLQQHSFTGLEGLGYSESRYFPFNSELVHALTAMPFDRDVLSPLVNLGWAALALLAAWCVGRRRGLGPLCVLGALVVLGLPTIAGTQPGQASNDIAAAALLLGA
ncbi:MAG TPA: hypothetical protein VMQ81_11970, partial [Acidimicrobiia bacterium]|nr:hypothetical protein [Acidimicrobiia bacterium]